MDFPWLSDVSGTRKHPGYLSKTNTPALSSALVRDLDGQQLPDDLMESSATAVLRSARRPRADTMPSSVFAYTPLHVSCTLPQVQSSGNTRHRSGSTTLAFERANSGGAASGPSLLTSALDYDDDQPVQAELARSTIESTLASLGLDDDQQSFPTNSITSTTSTVSATAIAGSGGSNNSKGYNSCFPSLSITAEASAPVPPGRTRAYTVGPERPDINRLLAPMRFDPFENEAPEPLRQQQNQLQPQRPRAVSLGIANHDGLPSPRELFNNLSGPSPAGSENSKTVQRELRSSRSSTSLDGKKMAIANEAEEITSGCSSPLSAVAQAPSRALWLGNITPSLSVSDLIHIFSCYGHVESARILSDKECAFVNFSLVDSAVAAKNDLETRLDNKLQGATVRVGYGRADVSQAMANTTEAGPNAQGPTRALWVGNIPANMNPAILQTIFQHFGPIESVRVLSHKNCGFVNFEQQQDAVLARKSLQNKEILGPGTGAVRIGFAKAPEETEKPSSIVHATMSNSSPDTYQATQWAAAMMMSSMMKGQYHGPYNQQAAATSSSPLSSATSSAQPTSLYAAIRTERQFIMEQLFQHETVSLCEDQIALPLSYHSTIPIVAELGADRKLEPLRLREMRKRLDAGGLTPLEIENMVAECMDEIVELCNDYIGNTVVQKLYECSPDESKLKMLERIAPYLASIGVHKNGTWAAQKIIDHSNTPVLVKLISSYIAPYVPLLLLDQYGNYVVQGCLRKGAQSSQYIVDAIADKCWEIGQGRFGARAVRAILENPVITVEQECYIAAAVIQNAVLLTTNANGVLLLAWLTDTSNLPGRFSALCPRLLPYLGKLCTHKLGAMTIFKMINQQHDQGARNVLLNALFDDPVLLSEVLRDQVHGLSLVSKIIGIPNLERRDSIIKQVKVALAERAHIQTYKRLFDELDEQEQMAPSSPDMSTNDDAAPDATATRLDPDNSNNDDHAWAKNPQAVAMMANMYAAAMAMAATNTQQQHMQQSTVPASTPASVSTLLPASLSSTTSAATSAAMPVAIPDLSEFDKIIKSLLRNNQP
ncbi:hypothetical protein BX666DRAFT_1913753 [Dichotomocladium elegans]|nr:hypothetical protein BX666DRAFT_1913753 [Dichotomocladium elegans]